MPCNISPNERIFRVIGGLVILGSGLLFGSWLGLLGLLPFATGATGFCPVYSLLGVNTCLAPVRR